MGSFYGSSFMYNYIPSEMYDLRIINLETGGSDGVAGGDIEVFEKFIYRKSKAYYYGRTQNIPLEFDLTIGSANPISGISRNLIEKWLLGRSGYLPFQIAQDDISDVVFNTIFTSATNQYYGNVQYGMTLHGKCDSPFGYTYPKTLAYTFSGNNIVDFNFDFFNDSADSDYLYPYLSFTLNTVGSNFQIINYSDANRTFLFTGLQPSETVTIDNNKQIVASSTGNLRISAFNKYWLRMIPGLNHLNVKSGIGTFSIVYSFARKVGA